ncbi:hypothetical protein VMCG_03490 [Cytospora schulzeri]|uniref:RING-type domain-containing protein n=1 Tax=Cytospora schulzeri TaxID=448051 RepID=A0A423WW36_9PEZI|nr:hypothetical protein VMCG_03490 [Valsa malicola]
MMGNIYVDGISNAVAITIVIVIAIIIDVETAIPHGYAKQSPCGQAPLHMHSPVTNIMDQFPLLIAPRLGISTGVRLLFSNPVWSGSDSIPSTVIRNITALSVSGPVPDASASRSRVSSRRRRRGHPVNVVQSDIAYSAELNDNITILSSKYSPTNNGVIQGLMYVPDLDDSDPCKELESAYIPSTAVRQSDLPPSDYNLIALVPWYNASCTRSYLSAATLDPIRAYITYRPDNRSEKPPGVDDKQWNLYDSGAWKKNSKFPVYAVPGIMGSAMMEALSQYSGNVSSVPYGENITAMYSPDADDYVRIWSQIHLATSDTLPTLWVFILVCIAVLLLVVAAISCLIHYIQRKRRTSLRSRVASGEVNLEAMNIKRVTVPIEHIEKFPLFTYSYEPNSNVSLPSPTSQQRPAPGHMRHNSVGMREMTLSNSAPTVSEKAPTSPAVRSSIAGPTGASKATDRQPTCTICSEDFQNRVTIIRELPCGHIYHPECIDEFLSEQSSLCPQCKALVLPKGYCPKITNAMVRRERAIRRLRGRIIVEDADMESGAVGTNN